MGVLAFISSLVLSLTVKVAEAMWATDIITTITNCRAEGFTSQSMQQGGIGLLMTVLIISTPPMAAMFFQGTVGSFMHFSAFAGGPASRPGPQGQPPGSYGGRGGGGAYAPPSYESGQTSKGDRASEAFTPSVNSGARGATHPANTHSDTMKYKPGA